MRRVGLALALLVVIVVAPTATAAGVPKWNHWLCFPGTANDWCSVDLTRTIWLANGTHKDVRVSVPPSPPIDCFYVYPTVAEDYQGNAPLKVEPEERETAITQASNFSHVCRVYAPLFRQVTSHAGSVGPFGVVIPQGHYEYEAEDVRAAWHDYLAHYNGGRGVVLIGHSDGAFLLKDLLADEYAKFKNVFVSAILLGGNVTVDAQNRFHGIPACTSPSELRCIVAYSSWDKTPPSNGFGESVKPPEHILCVNPGALDGGSAPITPIFAGINPQGIVPYGSVYVTHHFVEFPGLYTAKCVREGSRAWLLVSRVKNSGDKRPTVYEALGPHMGLHAADVNMTLADLVNLVGAQSKSWLRSLILARHGESEYSARGLLNGDLTVAVGLTGRGREEARRLGEALRDERLKLCVTSEFQRARETADEALQSRNIPRLVIHELNDPLIGPFEGGQLEPYRAWASTNPSTAVPGPGGESRRAIVDRYARGFRTLLARPEDTVLVVCHSLPVSYALEARQGRMPAARVPLVDYATPFSFTAAELDAATTLLESWAAHPTW